MKNMEKRWLQEIRGGSNLIKDFFLLPHFSMPNFQFLLSLTTTSNRIKILRIFVKFLSDQTFL